MNNISINSKVSYKTSKHSLQVYYGYILGYKLDKIYVSKFKFSDYSGYSTTTYIDVEDILPIK